LVALQLAFLPGCSSTVPATVTREPRAPLKANPTIFLEANRQRPHIEESLRRAGLHMAESFSGADYILNVKVGRNRSTRDCGGTSNVAYILDGNNRHLMVIKGRGLTGSCTPNVFDDMSQKLATYLAG
jgi:hypothetical protein